MVKKFPSSSAAKIIGSLLLLYPCVNPSPVQSSLPLPSVGAGASGALGFAPSEILSALKLEMAKVWLQEIRFKVDGQINNNSPVRVDVLFMNDEGLIKHIGDMSADEYFRNSEQILRDYRSSLEVFTTTIIPGQGNDPLYVVPKNVLSQMCVVFVNYGTPGSHRYNVGSDRIVELQLGPLGFTANTIRA